MYEAILPLHSYLAYIVLTLLFLAVANALIGWFGKKLFTPQKDFRLSLFTLILSHIQLLVGLLLFFVSANGFKAIQLLGVGGLNAPSRLLAVEHPFVNIIGVVLITIGWSRHKKFIEGDKKFKSIAIFYGLGLLCFLSRIPWEKWLS